MSYLWFGVAAMKPRERACREQKMLGADARRSSLI